MRRRECLRSGVSLIERSIKTTAIVKVRLRQHCRPSSPSMPHVSKHRQIPVPFGGCSILVQYHTAEDLTQNTLQHHAHLTSSQLVPTRPRTRVLCEAGPGAPQKLRKSVLLRRGICQGICAKDERDLGGVVGAEAWESLRVGERSVEVVSPCWNANRGCCIRP